MRTNKLTVILIITIMSLGFFSGVAWADWTCENGIIYSGINNLVGIGTTAPQKRLHVVGRVLAEANVGTLNFEIYRPTALFGYQSEIGFTFLNSNAEKVQTASVISVLDSSIAGSDKGSLAFYTKGADGLTERMRVFNNGNVGIGTTSPDAKLSVNGIIKAKEIRVTVTASGWSDFVFNKGYKLPSLDKVESYINENKHLPDVPSAQEVLKDGINVSDMMAKQMQKIEELTLYMIELKKENEALKNDNQAIKERLSRIDNAD